MRKTIGQFLRFCLVGLLGFIVDVVGLYVLVLFFSAGPYLGRVLSYVIAATVAWRLNRSFTFKFIGADKLLHREWVKYVAINAIGASINYSIYAFCVLYFEIPTTRLIIAVAAGSIAGLTFNFTANKWLVFR